MHFLWGFLIGILSIVTFVCVVFVMDDDGGNGNKRKKLRVGYNCVVEIDQDGMIFVRFLWLE